MSNRQKTGRNALCPCDSGKKYKKCHGSGKELTSNPPPQPFTQTIRMDGLPGFKQHLTIIPVFQDPADPRNRKGPEGEPGEYEVIFTFSRPGFPLQPEYEINSSEYLRGGSHLAISYPANPSDSQRKDRIKIDIIYNNTFLNFYGFPNKDGFLEKIVGKLIAKNFSDAHHKAFSALTPTLSDWSVNLDIPLNPYQVDIEEIASEARRIVHSMSFNPAPLVSNLSGNRDPDFVGYASIYREALNSNSSIYQFLCFFKVIESIQERRGIIAKNTKSQTQIDGRPKEFFPSSKDELFSWLNSLYLVRPQVWDDLTIESLLLPELVGKRFNRIIKSQLNPIRLNIAHALFGSSGLKFNIDDLSNHETVERFLPATKCIVRRMLKNEFPSCFLSHLPDVP